MAGTATVPARRRTAARRRAKVPAHGRIPSAPLAAAEPATIFVRGLAARAIIGIRPEERAKRQDVVIDLALDVATRAGRTDRIEDAVDYKVVKDQVLAYVEGSGHGLLEALAQGIADLCLAQPAVQAVEVTVDKPGALRFARSVAVRLRRERPRAKLQRRPRRRRPAGERP
jgi:D-erythro-7,8-dihydroneopterin triphosphate epimerase